MNLICASLSLLFITALGASTRSLTLDSCGSSPTQFTNTGLQDGPVVVSPPLPTGIASVERFDSLFSYLIHVLQFFGLTEHFASERSCDEAISEPNAYIHLFGLYVSTHILRYLSTTYSFHVRLAYLQPIGHWTCRVALCSAMIRIPCTHHPAKSPALSFLARCCLEHFLRFPH